MKRKPNSKPKAKRAAPSPAKPREFTDADGEAWLPSINQGALAKLVLSQAKYLLEWESQGMPRHPDGRYDATAVIAWLKEHWKRSVKASTPAEAGDTITRESYESLDAKYKALERRQKFLEGSGKLMPRIDAEREMLRMAMQVRASLMAQAEALGAQLANLAPADVAKRLSDRFQWICGVFEDGMVPLSAEVGAEIDAIVSRLRSESIPGPETAPA